MTINPCKILIDKELITNSEECNKYAEGTLS